MKNENGLTTVEFSVLAVAFFLIMLGSVEMSRLLFTWNTLDSITQRTARLAAVCPINSNDVKQRGMYGGSILPGLTAANIQIDYFDDTGGATALRSEADTVQVQIVNYTIDLAIPFIDLTGLTSPNFVHVVSAESLGFNPDDGTVSCFGPTA